MSLTLKEIQTAINKAGFGPLVVDGLPGPKTRDAIEDFQESKGLIADGRVGIKTAPLLRFYLDPPPLAPVAIAYDNEISACGMKDLIYSEGLRTKAYYDSVKVLTIGVGFTMHSAVFKKWWDANKGGPFTINSTMTESEIMALLPRMVDEEYGDDLDKFLGAVAVPKHVYDGMVSVVFNCGPGSLDWKWAAAAKGGDYRESARLLRDTAVTAKGPSGVRVRLSGLVARRAREANLIATGDYTRC